MPIISSSDIVVDDASDLLARIRESASALAFASARHRPLRGIPLFRNQAARDLGCLLDVDPAVSVLDVPADGPCLTAPGCTCRISPWSGPSGTVLVDAVPHGGETASAALGAECGPRPSDYRYEAIAECRPARRLPSRQCPRSPALRRLPRLARRPRPAAARCSRSRGRCRSPSACR